MRHIIGATLLTGVALVGGPSDAQVQSQSGIVKPNSQNLLQGPSSWSRQQRKLNVPGAATNPTMRQHGPTPSPGPAPLPVNPPPKPVT